MDGASREERTANMLALFSSLAGRLLQIDDALFLSEQSTGHRDRAIAYMMLNTGMISRDPNDVLDLYFRQCSVNVTTCDLAAMAATLANDGTNPITGQKVYEAQYVRRAVGHEFLRHVRLCRRMGLRGGACRSRAGSPAAFSPSFLARSASVCSRRPLTRMATACAAFACVRRSRRNSSSTPSTTAPMSGP